MSKVHYILSKDSLLLCYCYAIAMLLLCLREDMIHVRMPSVARNFAAVVQRRTVTGVLKRLPLGGVLQARFRKIRAHASCRRSSY